MDIVTIVSLPTYEYSKSCHKDFFDFTRCFTLTVNKNSFTFSFLILIIFIYSTPPIALHNVK